MTEPLPLIPNKQGEVVGDARPLLHAVFRDVIPPTLPHPAPPQPSGACNTPNELASTSWVQSYKCENKKLTDNEDELKDSFAKKLCRKHPLNEYNIRHYRRPETQGTWRLEKGLISRRDLKPTMVEDATGDSALWVRNCLADDSSMCDNTCSCTKLLNQKQICLEVHDKDTSYQSISVGPALKPSKPLSLAKPTIPPEPQYITCIPDEVEFVNFVIGQCYSETIRIVNMSKFELRLSLKPPSRRGLDIEIASNRGLTVSAGAAAKIKVRFRPTDVRIVEEELLVRSNKGKAVIIKIKCYMKPPTLELLLGIPDIVQYAKEEKDCIISIEYLDLGAKLLGDVFYAPLTFYSSTKYARFFIMTEDDWDEYIINEHASELYLSCDGFTMKPVYIEGGGWQQGSIWFHALNAGLHCLELKILSSTATVRSISVVADSIMFHPTNIYIQAQAKDFNICGDDDPGCMYYMNLGEAFPGRSLKSTMKLINNSAVSYSYCWKSRPWCVCSCYRDRDENSEFSDCIGDKLMSEEFEQHPLLEDEKQAEIFPREGILGAQETIDVTVTANASARCGMHRIVFMLILNNVPEESFPSSFKPDTIEAKVIESEPIPGAKPWKRTVHSFVLCQVEVWWKTVPMHFVMIPPALNLKHSLKVSNVVVELCACQTTGSEEIKTCLRDHESELRAELALPAARAPQAARISLVQPLRTKPTEDIAILEALSGEWQASTRVTTVPAPRTPNFHPSSGHQLLAYPGSMLTFEFTLRNYTYGPISWRAVSIPWKDTEVTARCMLAPCPLCYDRTCRCDALRPASGHLMHGEETQIVFRFSAPKTDGVYANLLSIRFTRLQGCEDNPNHSRNLRNMEEPRQFPASLVAYRVMTPVVVLRVKPCLSNCRHFSTFKCNRECQLDEAAHGSPNGTAVLRPKHIIYLGQRTCYTLTITNITPIPTKLTWEDDTYSEDYLTVTFVPNEIEIGGYAEVVTQVLLEGTGVCARRVSVRTATLLRSPIPVYLSIDTAVAGLEVIVEIPLGGPSSGYASLKLIQKEKSVQKQDHKMTSDEIFAENDRKKEINRANICNCKKELVYLPPKNTLRPPRDPDELSFDHYTPPEIVTKPPLTLICECLQENRPFTPTETEPFCLQFRAVPLHTERKQRIFLRNISPVTANWSTQIRRWPLSKTVTLKYEEIEIDPPKQLPVPNKYSWRRPKYGGGLCPAVGVQRLINDDDEVFIAKANNYTTEAQPFFLRYHQIDRWKKHLSEVGVGVAVTSNGSLSPYITTHIDITVYGDTWGVYHDELLIQIGELTPIIVDIWIEIVGSPLYFVFEQKNGSEDVLPQLCISRNDATRTVRAINESRTDLLIRSYLTTEHENPRDVMPFRVYIKLYDVEPTWCPCVDASSSADSFGYLRSTSGTSLEMSTGIELYIAPDYGYQNNQYYQVEPLETLAEAGKQIMWKVKMNEIDEREPIPHSILLLRMEPVITIGSFYARPPLAPRPLRVIAAPRHSKLQISCCRLVVRLNALELPTNNVLRIRKYTTLRNVGTAPICVTANASSPWRVLTEQPINMPPRSSMELTVEVEIEPPMALYAPIAKEENTLRDIMKISCTKLILNDKHNVMASIPMELRVEYPLLFVTPESINFHYVKTGDFRKTYFTVWHSSNTETMEAVVSKTEDVITVHPTELIIPPRSRVQVYVMYESRLIPPILDTLIRVVSKPERNWCTAHVRVEAEPARDYRCRLSIHDNTDDAVLLAKLSWMK